MSQVRAHISGGDEAVQMKAKLKAPPKSERETILADAQLPIVIPTDQSLAMKTDLALPWAKLRLINRYICVTLMGEGLKFFSPK